MYGNAAGWDDNLMGAGNYDTWAIKQLLRKTLKVVGKWENKRRKNRYAELQARSEWLQQLSPGRPLKNYLVISDTKEIRGISTESLVLKVKSVIWKTSVCTCGTQSGASCQRLHHTLWISTSEEDTAEANRLKSDTYTKNKSLSWRDSPFPIWEILFNLLHFTASFASVTCNQFQRARIISTTKWVVKYCFPFCLVVVWSRSCPVTVPNPVSPGQYK